MDDKKQKQLLWKEYLASYSKAKQQKKEGRKIVIKTKLKKKHADEKTLTDEIDYYNGRRQTTLFEMRKLVIKKNKPIIIPQTKQLCILKNTNKIEHTLSNLLNEMVEEVVKNHKTIYSDIWERVVNYDLKKQDGVVSTICKDEWLNDFINKENEKMEILIKKEDKFFDIKWLEYTKVYEKANNENKKGECEEEITMWMKLQKEHTSIETIEKETTYYKNELRKRSEQFLENESTNIPYIDELKSVFECPLFLEKRNKFINSIKKHELHYKRKSICNKVKLLSNDIIRIIRKELTQEQIKNTSLINSLIRDNFSYNGNFTRVRIIKKAKKTDEYISKQREIFIKNNISKTKKECALNDLYSYLKNVIKDIPNTNTRPNVSGLKDVKVYKSGRKKIGNPVQSMTLGLVKMRKLNLKDSLTKYGENMERRKINIKYSRLFSLLKKVANEFIPNFSYTSITCNHNLETKPHIDKNNFGSSYIIGVGDYTGGELFVNGEKHDIQNKFLEFDGGKNEHYTCPFEGDRWSFVYYNIKTKDKLKENKEIPKTELNNRDDEKKQQEGYFTKKQNKKLKNEDLQKKGKEKKNKIEEKKEVVLHVSHVKSLSTKNSITSTWEELYDVQIKKYNEVNKLGSTNYEIYDDSKPLKLHIDYDIYVDFDQYTIAYDNNLRNKIKGVLSKLYESDNWAIASDHRKVIKKNKDKRKKKKESFKMSYHFVCFDKMELISKQKKFLIENKNIFNENGLLTPDLAIYRSGTNKFRLPMSKKSWNDKSLLIPFNFREKRDFHKHLVSYTVGCKKANLKVTKQILTKVEEEVKKKYDSDNVFIKSILGLFTIKSEKRVSNSTGKYIYYDVHEKSCGIDHNNNNNYIIHDLNTNDLTIKCHSEKCKNFSNVLHTAVCKTRNFDHIHFNNIPLLEGRHDNYRECKRYFDNFFFRTLFCSSLYVKNHTYDSVSGLWGCNIQEVNPATLNEILYYKVSTKPPENDDEDEKDDTTQIEMDRGWKRCCFYKRYKHDFSTKVYNRIGFTPIGIGEERKNIEKEKGLYNMFTGFGYKKALNSYQKRTIPDDKKKDFKCFMSYILNYCCGFKKWKNKGDTKKMRKCFALYKFLLKYMKCCLSRPQFLNEIMLIFFSPTHGTGKSKLASFLASVIGEDYYHSVSVDELTEKHATSHVNKLINVIEETNKKDTYKFRSFIKKICQRKEALYNEKSKKIKQIKTYVRYIATTNYFNGMHMDADARRFVVYTFDKCEDNELIKKITRMYNDPYIVYQFGKFLEESVADDWETVNEWRNNRPLTDDYYRMQQSDSVAQFLYDFVIKEDDLPITGDDYCVRDKEKFEDEILIPRKTLYSLFVDYCKQTRDTNMSKKTFNNHLSNYHSDSIQTLKNENGKVFRSNRVLGGSILAVIKLRKLYTTLNQTDENFQNYYDFSIETNNDDPKYLNLKTEDNKNFSILSDFMPIDLNDKIQTMINKMNSFLDKKPIKEYETKVKNKNIIDNKKKSHTHDAIKNKVENDLHGVFLRKDQVIKLCNIQSTIVSSHNEKEWFDYISCNFGKSIIDDINEHIINEQLKNNGKIYKFK